MSYVKKRRKDTHKLNQGRWSVARNFSEPSGLVVVQFFLYLECMTPRFRQVTLYQHHRLGISPRTTHHRHNVVCFVVLFQNLERPPPDWQNICCHKIAPCVLVSFDSDVEKVEFQITYFFLLSVVNVLLMKSSPCLGPCNLLGLFLLVVHRFRFFTGQPESLSITSAAHGTVTWVDTGFWKGT